VQTDGYCDELHCKERGSERSGFLRHFISSDCAESATGQNFPKIESRRVVVKSGHFVARMHLLIERTNFSVEPVDTR
jgi:hypothetical protein